MRIPLLVLFVVLTCCSYAQDLDVDTSYFDVNENFVTEKNESYYYIIDSAVGKVSKKDAFYSSNGRLMFAEERGEINKNKRRAYYYPTGELMARGTFLGFLPQEVLMVWYPEGKRLAEIEFKEHQTNEGPDFLVRAYWDPAGNKLVDGGSGSGKFDFPLLKETLSPGEGSFEKALKTGIWKGDSNGGTYEEEYKEGIIVSGVFRKEGKEYSYKRLTDVPGFKGGVQGLMKYISSEIKYPLKARKAKAEGSVFVEFLVLEDGRISDVKVVKGVHPELDKEAKRVVEGMPDWIPGVRRGYPTKRRFVLPVKFLIA